MITREIVQTMRGRIEEIIKVTILDIYICVYKRYNIKISESTASRFFSSPRIFSMDLSMFTFKRVANWDPTSNSLHINDMISWFYMAKEYQGV